MQSDLTDPSGEVGERVAVGGQDDGDTLQHRDALQRAEVVVERIVGVAEAADVRRDRGQHVVAREHHTVLRVEQAEVIGRVTRCVHRDPIAAGEAHDIGVLDAARRAGERLADVGKRGTVALAFDGWWREEAAPLRAPGERGVIALAVPVPGPFDRFVADEVGALLGLEAIVARPVDRVVAVTASRRGPRLAELSMGDDLGAGLVTQSRRPTEVIGMGVGHDHRVDSGERKPRAAEPGDERLPRFRPGQAGIDDGQPALVFQEVAVDVPEAGELDR